MICLNCKKQIPDDSNSCPFCGQGIEHKEQVKTEIKVRRYQRWIFYGIAGFIFLTMLVAMIITYNANTNLVLEITNIEEELTSKEGVLEQTKEDLKKRVNLIQEMEIKVAEKNKENKKLQSLTEDFKAKFEEKEAEAEVVKKEAMEKEEDAKESLQAADANIYSLIIKLGQGVTNENLVRIPLADANLEGIDMDEDGLSDLVEESIGSDPQKKDTDEDGYSDKDEVLNGYNPIDAEKLPIDNEYALRQAGKILLQVETNGEAWYVAGDGKRYFLGNPGDAFGVMRGLDYWTKDWKKEESAVAEEVK